MYCTGRHTISERQWCDRPDSDRASVHCDAVDYCHSVLWLQSRPRSCLTRDPSPSTRSLQLRQRSDQLAVNWTSTWMSYCAHHHAPGRVPSLTPHRQCPAAAAATDDGSRPCWSPVARAAGGVHATTNEPRPWMSERTDGRTVGAARADHIASCRRCRRHATLQSLSHRLSFFHQLTATSSTEHRLALQKIDGYISPAACLSDPLTAHTKQTIVNISDTCFSCWHTHITTTDHLPRVTWSFCSKRQQHLCRYVTEWNAMNQCPCLAFSRARPVLLVRPYLTVHSQPRPSHGQLLFGVSFIHKDTLS